MRMTLPFTETRPAVIISSHSRREANPAFANTFCKRSALKSIPLYCFHKIAVNYWLIV